MPSTVPAHLFRLHELMEEHCSPEWRELMNERNEVIHIRKGEKLFAQGEVAQRMFMVKDGRVKVGVQSPNRVERIVRFAGAGEVVGHRGIGTDLIYTATVTALTDTTLDSVPMKLFLSVLRANNMFCYQFLLFFAEELRALDRQMRDLMIMTVPQRVARALKMNIDSFGFDGKDKKKLAFTISRKDMASAADTSYESVIRTMAEFQRQGIIEMIGKEVRILDMKALRAQVGGGKG